jgi:tetratricopeptide (TPR) repeat protein
MARRLGTSQPTLNRLENAAQNTTLKTLGALCRALGRFAEAFGRLREAIHVAEAAGHVHSLLRPLFGLGTLKLDQGDFAWAVGPLERGLELCRTREVPLLLHDFAWALGAAYHGTGRRAEGVALMEDAARGFAERAVRPSLGWASRVRSLGGAYLLDGRLADATRIAQDGLAAARQRGERGAEGQLLRLLGDIAAHPDRVEVDTAQAHYRQALALAEELGLRPLMARCHLGLGVLYRRAGKRDQAGEHLVTATAMHREMGMAYWLEQAERARRSSKVVGCDLLTCHDISRLTTASFAPVPTMLSRKPGSHTLGATQYHGHSVYTASTQPVYLLR